MASDLTRIGEKARKEPKLCFTSLYHHVTDVDNLRECYRRIKPGKASGIDGVTKEEYGKDLEGNLSDLSERLKRLAYRPQPVRRKYIPKLGSDKMRPLGIPCLEDKIVQLALVRVLEQIYEADFLDCSHGYRPERTPHQALDELGRTIQWRKVNLVADADIQGFFDHVNHEWMIKFLSHRIGDKRVLRLIWRMLKAGIMEDGLTKASDEGTPQGGNLSPLLSNVYLHYVLDLWFERRFKKQCRGEAYLFRFADDFITCFQDRTDATRYLKELRERLEKFHLQLESNKTKLIEFGRFAEERAKRKGRKLGEFDYLGFTHYCSRTRRGRFKVKRRTSSKRFRAKLKQMHQWLRSNRSKLQRSGMLRKAKVRLVGHLNYYAITDNAPMCDSFRHQVERKLFYWLNRRSQRRSYNWQRFRDALDWLRWPSVCIIHHLDPYRRVSAPSG